MSVTTRNLFSNRNFEPEPKQNENVNFTRATLCEFEVLSCFPISYNLTGQNKIVSEIPESYDPCLRQNGGFSFSCWFQLSKLVKGKHQLIFKKGERLNEQSPILGILPSSNSLFVKLKTTEGKLEKIYSNRKLEALRIYCIFVTCRFDLDSNSTEMSLFIDGLIDSSIIFSGLPAQNTGSVVLGKSDKELNSVEGIVGDIEFIKLALSEKQVKDYFKTCSLNYHMKQDPSSKTILSKIVERVYLIREMVACTDKSEEQIEQMNMTNYELREILKTYKGDLIEQKEEIEKVDNEQKKEEKMITELNELIWREETPICLWAKKLYTNSKLIYSVLNLAADSADDEYLPLNRFINILEVLSPSIILPEIDDNILVLLAKALKAHKSTKDEKKQFMVYHFIAWESFMKHIFKFVPILFPNLITQVTKKQEVKNNETPYEKYEHILKQNQNFSNFFENETEKELKSSKLKSGFMRYSSRKAVEDVKIETENSYQMNENKEGHHENHELDNVMKDYSEFESHSDFNHIDVNSHAEKLKDSKRKESNFHDERITSKKGSVQISEAHGSVVKHSEHERELSENENEKLKSAEEQENDLLDQVLGEDRDDEHDKKTKKDKNSSSSSKSKDSSEKKLKKKKKKLEKKEKELNLRYEELRQKEEEIKNRPTAIQSAVTHVDIYSTRREIEDMKSIDEVDEKKFAQFDMEVQEKKEQQVEAVLEAHNDAEWNMGEFEVIINYCRKCHTHQTTTNHYEFIYVKKFNELCEEIQTVFPSVVIKGNHEKLEYFGQFDIYLRGVGKNLDEDGRYFIYQRKEGKRFPNPRMIIDRLIALSLLYESSANLATAQNKFKSKRRFNQPSEELHDFPAELSKEAQEFKDIYENARAKPVDL